jgi:predicted phage-related endonuclease
MQIHELIQGSDEWHQFRLEHFGASEAAAMLGLSKKVKRNDLLHMKHTGTAKEFGDWVQEHILDYGHEVEALARPINEKIIGKRLYPVTCSEGRLSASCDGLTMSETDGWEHKQWNAELAAAVAAKELPDEFMVQPQQCLLVTGAERWRFTVSDGTEENMVSMDILPDPVWFERIRAGWEQFEKDLAEYQPREIAEKPKADAILALPALAIQIRGEVASSNLPVFKASAERFIAAINTDLKTDEDFAVAEATVKFCAEAEKNIELTKAAAIAQTSSIDELMRTLDHIQAQLRDKRLTLDKLVKSQKETIKTAILAEAKLKFGEHIASLEAEIKPIRLVYAQPDFAGAMKNKRTLASLHDAVDSELANMKIAADAVAKDVRAKLAWCKTTAEGFGFLFSDLQHVIYKPMDDFQMLVNTRIADHKKAVAEKEEADRKRIAEEERVKIEANLRAEQEAIAAVERAKRAAEDAEQRAAAEAEERRIAKAAADEAERVRLQSIADQALADARNPSADVIELFEKAPAEEPAAQVTPPSLRLGQIGERLGFAVTADFLRSLGFEPAGREKSAVLYHESSFPNICAKLINHINQVQAKQAA